MKALKTLFVFSFLLVCGISFAQPPGDGQRGGQQGPPPIPSAKQIKKMVAELDKTISLTDDQEVKIMGLYAGHFEDIEEKTSGNKRPSKDDMAKLRSDLEKSVKAELTKEQVSKYESYLKKQSSQHQRR